MKKHLKFSGSSPVPSWRLRSEVLVLRPLLSGGSALTYVTKPVAYADIAATVNETGIVNPVTQVMVGSEVSGTVRTLNVDFNSNGAQGQVLANLDRRPTRRAVDSSQRETSPWHERMRRAPVVNVAKMKGRGSTWRTWTVQRDEPLFSKGLNSDQNQMDTGADRGENRGAGLPMAAQSPGSRSSSRENPGRERSAQAIAVQPVEDP